MSKAARWALMSSVVIGLYAAIGFLIAPPIVRSQLESVLTEQLGHPVTVKDVRINPFALSLTLRDFAISERDRTPLLGFDELYINVEVASLVNRAPTFSAIRLLRPYAVARVRQDGSFNLADLRPPATASDHPPEPPSHDEPTASAEKTLPGVIVEVLQVDGGTLEFHDDSKPTPFAADIVPITFTLQHFSTMPDSPDTLSFTAEVGPGERIEWRGAVHIQPLRSEGTLALSGIKVRTLWSYLQDLVKFEVMDGVIDLKLDYTAKSDHDSFQAAVKEGTIALTKFALGEKGSSEPVIVVPEFSVGGIEADLSPREVRIAEVRSKDGRISGWLDRERHTNFQALFAGDQSQTASAPPSPQTSAPPAAKPWLVKINQVAIDNYGITLEDRQPAAPVRLTVNPLSVKLANVSSRLDTAIAVDLSARVNDTGTVAVKGDVIADPLALNLDLDVNKIAFPPFQPYLDELVQLNLKGGYAAVKGHLSYGPKQGTKPQMRFDGAAGITDLLMQDKPLNKDFLKWNGLALDGIGLEVDPTRVSIAEIVLTKPYVRFIISPDRTTNVQQLFARPESGTQVEEPPPPQNATTKPASNQPIPIRIGLIRFIDGSAHFSDLSLKPVIDTGLIGLNGTIKGLSSKELSKADVSIDGTVDKYAPVAVKGTINPLAGDAFTDIGVSFKNVELTTVSPYATKFAGYPITKGKISLDLRYKLNKKVLDAENNVLIEQLTLGDRIEGPDATSLPVKLAIALLKDRKGVIDIDLPVRGDLNDPDFKYGKVLLGVLMNLITKAVTSPFNLVAGLVGGSGEELSVVEFPAGSPTLAPAEESKLKTLAKALDERPGLRLDVAGAADPEADRLALAEQKLNRDLFALKTAGVNAASKPPVKETDVSRLPESEQADLVKALYLEKYGKLPESPPAPAQTDKPLPVPTQQLKSRLLGDIVIDAGELRRLGQERARRVQEFLLAQGSIQPERVYLLDVRTDAKAKDGIVASNLSLTSE